MREVDGHPVITNAKITELLVTEGVDRTSTDEAIAGDIVAVAGLPENMIATRWPTEHAHAVLLDAWTRTYCYVSKDAGGNASVFRAVGG